MRRSSMYFLLIFVLFTCAEGIHAEAPAPGSFVYKKIGETELSLTVYYPEGWEANQQRPAIVFFFGGGWVQGTTKQFEPQSKSLSSRGMMAICADYRVKSRHEVTPDACVEDAKSAIRWVRQHSKELGIDPNKVVGAGGSAGGHLAACTGICLGLDAVGEDLSISSRPNLLVLYNPALNLNESRILERLKNDVKMAKAISPTLHLKQDSPPALLLYGTADFLISQGTEFMTKSKELGHEAEIYLAEDQKHGFFNREPWLARTTQRVDEFLVKHGYLTAK